jgi:hypothetical protein
MIDVAEDTSKILMRKFLTDTSEKYEIKTQLIHFYRQIEHI